MNREDSTRIVFSIRRKGPGDLTPDGPRVFAHTLVCFAAVDDPVFDDSRDALPIGNQEPFQSYPHRGTWDCGEFVGLCPAGALSNGGKDIECVGRTCARWSCPS